MSKAGAQAFASESGDRGTGPLAVVVAVGGRTNRRKRTADADPVEEDPDDDDPVEGAPVVDDDPDDNPEPATVGPAPGKPGPEGSRTPWPCIWPGGNWL